MSTAVEAYEAIAPRYESLESKNRILAMMRARSLSRLLADMPAGGRLIELGCGSGSEALAVARAKGARVLAFEPSPSLAALSRMKAREAGLPVEVQEATASAALRALGDAGEAFDGGWASFSLGYDAPLEELRSLLARVLAPGAPFVCSLRNPWCIAAPWSIPARLSGRYRHTVGDAHVPIFHASLRAAVRTLAPDFHLLRAEGLPVLVPPPRYGRAWARLGHLASAVEAADGRVAAKPPFTHLGDHTLLTFRRRGTPVGGYG